MCNGRGVPARAALALVAIVLLAWLGVMERDARLQSRGLEAAGHGDAVRAHADLRRATFLNPDTAPDVLRGLLSFGRGDRARAAATLEGVVCREPENLNAWRSLMLVARGGDPEALRRADRASRRLDPLGARGD